MGIDRLLLVTGKVVGKALKSKVVEDAVDNINKKTGNLLESLLDNKLEKMEKILTKIINRGNKNFYLREYEIEKLLEFFETEDGDSVRTTELLYYKFCSLYSYEKNYYTKLSKMKLIKTKEEIDYIDSLNEKETIEELYKSFYKLHEFVSIKLDFKKFEQYNK